MMQDNIGKLYEIVSSIIGIIGGGLGIIYRKEFLEYQKSYLSKHNDFLNQKMLVNINSRSNENSYLWIVIASILLIIFGVITLWNYIFV